LKLKKELAPHEAWIYAMAIDSTGRLYTSSCDGTIKVYEKPLESDECKNVLQDMDEIISLYVDKKDALFSGDTHGKISKWVDYKIKVKLEVVEEVTGLAVEGNNVFSVRNQELTISEILPGSTKAIYTTKASIPGHAPLALCGPNIDDKAAFIVMLERDCKTIQAIKNTDKFPVAWRKSDSHDLIVNALCGSTTEIYSGGYDNKVKRWTNIEKEPTFGGEAAIDTCVNTICLGAEAGKVYAAGSDGLVKLINFN
jgi:WD40 repeat protein